MQEKSTREVFLKYHDPERRKYRPRPRESKGDFSAHMVTSSLRDVSDPPSDHQSIAYIGDPHNTTDDELIIPTPGSTCYSLDGTVKCTFLRYGETAPLGGGGDMLAIVQTADRAPSENDDGSTSNAQIQLLKIEIPVRFVFLTNSI